MISVQEDEKFYVYSSDAGQSASNNKLILSPGIPIDKFVSSLKGKVVILKNQPKEPVYTPLDDSDLWKEWMGRFDTNATLNLMLDSNLKALQSFLFSFETPWGTLSFDSSSQYLQSAFEKGVADTIGPPGAAIDGTSPILYNGLVAPKSPYTPTVEALFTFVGLSDMIATLPPFVPQLEVSLDASNYVQGRNAMWFNPRLGYQTTIRLQFQLKDGKALEQLFQQALPGITISAPKVICKKILTEGQTVDGAVSIDQGSVSFQATCTVSAKSGNPLTALTAGIEFDEAGITLTLKLSKGILDALLQWLGELIGVKPDSVKGIFGGQGDRTFQGLNVQQVVFRLEKTADLNSYQLASARVDMEVAGDFGKIDGKKPVFLASYIWTREIGGLGNIRGELWNSYDISKQRVLQPRYELWTDLVPFTKNPGTEINLETLIPGVQVDIPQNIPSKVSRALLVLSSNHVAFGATVVAVKNASPGQVPQPYLGELGLDVSYTRGKQEKEFLFQFEVMAGIQPGKGSSHPEDDATLIGDFTYTRVN
ncbi:uncharacterized protein ATNIH1004_001844 [Aspergillus tanneri]|uniref:Uncharacterized protein n=1 Tax=Aspergillus tanneri TaxID=1220188 RepID=A0A5M9N0R8_9EURO|nr:uncharacterized protein ATNIH1004_001844 [Aspergillus tanneri]KAA8652935.1 hypothetical protein ATNIH1004_001844 [Aspergillus tanneri]